MYEQIWVGEFTNNKNEKKKRFGSFAIFMDR